MTWTAAAAAGAGAKEGAGAIPFGATPPTAAVADAVVILFGRGAREKGPRVRRFLRVNRGKTLVGVAGEGVGETRESKKRASRRFQREQRKETSAVWPCLILYFHIYA